MNKESHYFLLQFVYFNINIFWKMNNFTKKNIF